jgi:hypothetical protein
MKNTHVTKSQPRAIQKALGIVLVFFAGLLSLGQLQRLQIAPSLAFHLHDLFILQALVVGYVASAEYRSSVREFLFQRTVLEKLFLGLVALGWGVGMLFGHSLMRPLLYTSRLLIYFLFGHLLFFLVQKKLLKPINVSFAFLVFAILVAVFGLLQYVFLPDTRFLFFLGWDDHYYRLISTLLDPGFTGLILVMSIWLLQRFAKQLRPAHRQFVVPTLTILFLVTLLLTYSRASYLAFAFTTGIFIVFQVLRRKMKVALLWSLIILLFIAAIPFLPRPGGEGVKLERTVSTTARLGTAQKYLQSINGYEWVIGKGLFVSQKTLIDQDGFELPDHAQVADSWPIFILSGTGIIGLFLFLLLLVQKANLLYPNNKELLLMGIAVLVHGVFNASVIYPFVILFIVGSFVGTFTQKT